MSRHPFNAAAARAKRPCPLWVDAFQRDTQHLAADEIGAYLLLLMAMWTRESCDFPDDDTRLARVCRVSVRLWKSRIGPTLRTFLNARDGHRARGTLWPYLWRRLCFHSRRPILLSRRRQLPAT